MRTSVALFLASMLRASRSPYNKMIQKNMAEREANLAKAEDLRLAFKQRNPDNQPLPGLPNPRKPLYCTEKRG